MIGIIPAAGKGIRFKELGKNYNKCVLPFKEKPIIIHNIEWLEKHNCKEIRVIVNHAENTVKDILKLYNKLNNVKIVKQYEVNGLAGAIDAALDYNDDDDVLIVLGDIIVQSNISFNTFKNNFVSIKIVPDYSRWCMVKVNNNVCEQFYDKPQEKPDTKYALSGVYYLKNSKVLKEKLSEVLNNDSYKILNEFQFSSVLEKIENIHTVELEILDFGTLEEFLENKNISISRSFNEIIINGDFVTKSSVIGEKIIKEYNWFSNLPDELKVYTPRLFGYDFYGEKIYYKMEKIRAPSLREIYLFLDSSEETWFRIFELLFNMLDKMLNYGKTNSFTDFIYLKTKERVQDLEIPVENKIINKFLNDLRDSLNTFKKPALMHGDFCFSNLMYDMKDKIVMIDPRGELFGDHYYDVAKLCHSILYDYDFIDAELYVKENDNYIIYNNGKEKIKNIFRQFLKQRYTNEEIKHIELLTASLFLSLIPLHYHNETNQKIYYNIFKNIYLNM